MRLKIFFPALMVVILTLSTAGCGVPKSEHEKIVSELENANQEKTTLSDQVNKLKAEKEALSLKISQEENELSTLRQENEDLKVKMSKPAAKKATPPSKKKK